MKTVFTNAMLAHVWAQQTQSYGKSNSMHFVDAVLYSYSTPIARIVKARGGARVLLRTSESYSVTTSGHCGRAVGAFSGPWFDVPSLGVSGGRHHGDEKLNHRANLAHLVGQYAAEKKRLMRARNLWQAVADYLRPYAETAESYATLFGLKCELCSNVDDDAAEIAATRAKREAAASTPAAKAKRAKAQAAREAREAERRRLEQASAAERIAAWRAGEQVALSWSERSVDMLRIRGDIVETSRGATVALAEAVRAFQFVRAHRDAGRSWKRNGETFAVGHFQLDSIDASGEVKVGCHTFAWSEVETFAKAAQLIS